MERLKLPLYFLVVLVISACSETTSSKISEVAAEEDPKLSLLLQDSLLKEKGFQTFMYVDQETGDSTLMQQYFMVFLKRGSNRDQDREALDSLQRLHLEHLGRMYREGYADISGPMGSDGDLRGITIYNTPTLEIADSLARIDPMVQSGRLEIEVHPWWAGKGLPLR